MISKKFSQELHDKFDQQARDAITFWLGKQGFQAKPHPDKYDIDLVVYKGDSITGYAEVEVRQWNPCPYETIHVPYRKIKFFTREEPTVFFALTKDLSHAYWVDVKEIPHHPIIEVKNREVPNGELFFDVPTKKFTYINIGTK